MKRIKKSLLIILGVVLSAILAGPFFVPLSSTKGLVSPDTLADSESRFLELGDFTIHFRTLGSQSL